MEQTFRSLLVTECLGLQRIIRKPSNVHISIFFCCNKSCCCLYCSALTIVMNTPTCLSAHCSSGCHAAFKYVAYIEQNKRTIRKNADIHISGSFRYNPNQVQRIKPFPAVQTLMLHKRLTGHQGPKSRFLSLTSVFPLLYMGPYTLQQNFECFCHNFAEERGV